MALDAALTAAGRLQPDCQSFVRAARGTPVGVVLLLHGWTAGPWQFFELADSLAEVGLTCYAPRLPGHGARRTDGGEDPSELPRGGQMARYTAFADAALGHARALAGAAGLPLHVVGFSMGGAVACDLAARYGHAIGRLLLVAPLLRPRGRGARVAFVVLRALQRLGLTGWLDRRPMSWGRRPLTPPDGWARPGHWQFWLGNLLAVLGYAQAVRRACRQLTMPTQLVVTDADDKCDAGAARRLLAASPGPHAVLRFAAHLGVPHAMLSGRENSGVSRARVLTTARDFLARGILDEAALM